MTVAPSLRDRRRIQTEHDIQSAALRLALRHGYDGVTTEMIAAEAGISLRTFFNYYANKDAALTGSQPVIAPEMAAWLQAGKGALLDDLCAVLDHMLQNGSLSRDRTRMISTLLERSPELLPTFHASLGRLAGQLTQMIAARIGAPYRGEAGLAADLVAHAMADAFLEWSKDDDMDESGIIEVTRHKIGNVWKMLVEQS